MMRQQRSLFFCFLDSSSSKWAWLLRNKKLRHVFLLIFDGDRWLAIHPQGKSNRVEVLSTGDPNFILKAEVALKMTAVIGVKAFAEWPEKASNPFISFGQTCNEVVRKCSGLKLPFSRTPAHLHKLLRKFNGKGYEIFYMKQSNGKDSDYILVA